jgi:uncharacterized protein
MILGAVLLSAAYGYAASPEGGAPESARTAAGQNARHLKDTADHVRITAADRDVSDADRIVVTVEIDRGFHINANPASFDYLIPTMLKVTNQTPLRVVYPRPVRFKPKFADEVLDVYEGTIRITAEFPQGTLARTPYLLGAVTAQACTDEICLPPADLALPHE